MVLDASSGNPIMLISCSQLVTERLYPHAILPPHHSTSLRLRDPHFNPKTDIATAAGCTTCTFIEDTSNCWTAVLYFKARNGSLKGAPQKGNVRFESANGGGQTLFFRQPTNTGLKRASTRSGETLYFPNTTCAVGIMANARLPTCCDGVNYDSADQQSHAAYPQSGTFENGGPCPSTHSVHVSQLLYETPFVSSNGDPTGYGTHAGYLFCWKGESMQRAMEANCDVSCPTLKSQTIAQANKCFKSMNVKEDIDGCHVAAIHHLLHHTRHHQQDEPSEVPLSNAPNQSTAI
ncbi:hypothetical protein BGZ57DRAFT_940379 [Hyaloscypha finlandica]|nr:hypothetical protein BGZ57DRAFT_940379 [Hyaloscypha finlandica]